MSEKVDFNIGDVIILGEDLEAAPCVFYGVYIVKKPFSKEQILLKCGEKSYMYNMYEYLIDHKIVEKAEVKYFTVDLGNGPLTGIYGKGGAKIVPV